MSDARNGYEHGHERGYERWSALMDRQALGEALTADEASFCKHFAQERPECARELEIYAELGTIDDQPSDASRALVDATLLRMEAEDAAPRVPEIRSLRDNRARVLAVASFVLAAAAMFALYVRPSPKRSDTRSDTRSDSEELRGAQAVTLTRAELVYASGKVSVGGVAATVGRTLLAEGSLIETGDGAACVLIDPDINVCLSAQSRMRLSKLASRARRLDLLSGKASTRLSTQPEGMSLSIMADGVASTAIGTAFSVERSENGDGVVTTVLNGKVRVGREDRTEIVSAHERSTVSRARAEVKPLSRSEEAPSWALLGPTALWHDPVSATINVHGEPLDAEALLDDQPIGIAPLSSLIPVGAHHLVIRSGNGQVLVTRELHLIAGETQEITYAKLVEATVAVAPKPEVLAKPLGHGAEENAKLLTKRELEPAANAEQLVPARLSAGELLRDARKLMREGRFAEAGTTYETVRRDYPESDEAHTVLVSLGQMQLVQLKEPARALGTLDAYLVRGGALAQEARVLRIQALAALGRSADEASAIEEFLAKHPQSFEAGALRARLSILREER